MTSTSVVFEPLPPKAPGAGKGRPTAKWVDELKARPNEWARLPLKSTSNPKHYRSRGIELSQRTVDGETRIYGRYVGVS